MNFKKILIRVAVVSAIVLMIGSIVNCSSPVSFTGTSTLNSSDSVGGGSSNSNSGTTTTTSTSSGPVSCNPFGMSGSSSMSSSTGSSSSSTPINGLEAQGVYYINQDVAGASPGNAINNSVENLVNESSPLVEFSKMSIYLPNINAPDMFFTQGIIDAATGMPIEDSSGKTLISYFGFRLQGNFVAGNWPTGNYQIAILADDGAVLTIAGGASDGSNFVINDDGFHSMQMGCSSQVIHITAGSSYPLTFDYMQGPPTSLGMIMLYRPVTVAGSAKDPLCGQGNSSDSFYFLDHTASNTALVPSVAQAPYEQLTGPFDSTTGTGGWTPVESNHFVLPNNTINPCAPAAP